MVRGIPFTVCHLWVVVLQGLLSLNSGYVQRSSVPTFANSQSSIIHSVQVI